jgi:predicted nucleic acid-binding protein
VILIDSNIVIDVYGDDVRWAEWSIGKIGELSRVEQLVINHIVVAEVSPRHGSLASFHAMLQDLSISVEPFSDEAAFEAGSAFQRYRKNGGNTKSVLPDFFIGAHAQTIGATILTRDPRFYRAYFPDVPLIAPEKDDE